ncbi:MAG TPA: archaemetzincin [Thermoanaerobaculia bacterium]|nr:archaemetzincin [Thermoanaerobaculia bacterium]
MNRPALGAIFAILAAISATLAACGRAAEPMSAQTPPPLAEDAGFEKLPKPGPLDWLATHTEAGQTYSQYLLSGANRPDATRHTIYILPLGTFGDNAPSLERLREFTSAFFMLDVTVLEGIAIDPSITSRDNGGVHQLYGPDLLAMLRKRLPPDAYCILGVTMSDLYPNPQWNFVFGVASLEDRVGVYSFARYDPRFYGKLAGADVQTVILRRSCKVLAHETLHMFGMPHCIFYKCVLNGSNSLAEADSRPLHLCPIDLRKLETAVKFDPRERYQRLRDFCARNGFDEETARLDARLGKP